MVRLLARRMRMGGERAKGVIVEGVGGLLGLICGHGSYVGNPRPQSKTPPLSRGRLCLSVQGCLLALALAAQVFAHDIGVEHDLGIELGAIFQLVQRVQAHLAEDARRGRDQANRLGGISVEMLMDRRRRNVDVIASFPLEPLDLFARLPNERVGDLGVAILMQVVDANTLTEINDRTRLPLQTLPADCLCGDRLRCVVVAAL